MAACITVLNYVSVYYPAWQILCVSFAAFVCNCNKETLLLLLLLLYKATKQSVVLLVMVGTLHYSNTHAQW